MIKQNTYEKIRIPTIEEDEFTVEFDHKGHESVDSMAGKLIVKVRVLPHKIFTRKRLDVYSTVFVPYHTSVLGGDVIVETLVGQEMIRIEPFMAHDSVYKLAKKGFKNMTSGLSGDHYISFILKAPDGLSDEEKHLYKLLSSTG